MVTGEVSQLMLLYPQLETNIRTTTSDPFHNIVSGCDPTGLFFC